MEGTLKLKDGRMLGYGIYGDLNGVPIIDIHGIPGSRLEASLFSRFLKRKDICFIGIDRPGYGISSPKVGFRVRDFPADVMELANHLGLQELSILGYSGGGPFALACACHYPERVRVVGIVSGVGPSETGSEGMHDSNRSKFNLAQRLPWLAKGMLSLAFLPLQHHPEKLADQMKKVWMQMPEPDQKALADQEFAEGILSVTKDAISKGIRGWVNEEVLMAQPWGFKLYEIRSVKTILWHGMQDRNVPISMAKRTASGLKNCQTYYFQDEGHISILYNRANEIIDELIK